jgi:hypothetical protein
MRIEHRPVVIDGQRLGDLVSCDRRFRFFTTDSDLAALDGQAFEDVSVAMAAIKRALVAAGRLKPAVVSAADGSGAASVPAGLARPAAPSAARQFQRPLGTAIAVNAVAGPNGHPADTVGNRDAS